MLDFNETICEAIDTIVKKRIEDVSFDQTIVCTIEEDADRKNGHYLVSNDDTRFDAYCDYKHYHKNDQVQVLIPGGDFSSPQKTIIGRYSANASERPITYVQPFEQLVLMSKNLIPEVKEASILANKLNNQKQHPRIEKVIYNHIAVDTLKTMTSFGIKAKFKNFFGNHEVTKGAFGLHITIEDEQQMAYHFYWDSAEMFGNPYKFMVYTPQEKKFDLSNYPINIIKNITIALYQDGQFMEYDNYIKFQNDLQNTEDNKEDPFENIFVSDIELYLANDVTIKPVDDFEIYCDTNLYSGAVNPLTNEPDNKRIIRNIWYHTDENKKFIGYADKGKNNKYNLQWFYFKQGIWEPIGDSYSENLSKDTLIELQTDLKKDYIKAVLTYNEIPYESNILTFENTGIKDSLLGADRVAALTIHLGEKTPQSFPFYGDDNKLISPTQANINRELKLHYAPLNLNITEDEFFRRAAVVWYIPNGTTMLNYDISYLTQQGFSRVLENSEYYKDGWIGFIHNYSSINNNNNKFYFTIRPEYEKVLFLNTIMCIAYHNKLEYKAEMSFDFSSYGSNGTKYNPMVIPISGIRSFNEDTLIEDIVLEAKLYDPEFNLIPLKKNDVKWEYLDGRKIKDEDYILNTPRIKIRPELNKYNVLKATIKVNSKLFVSCYYALPYAQKTDYFAIAPTEIIYNSTGTNPIYYKGLIQIYNSKDNMPLKLEEDYIRWEMRYHQLKGNESPINKKLKQFLPKLEMLNTAWDIEKKNISYSDYAIAAPRMYMQDVAVGISLVATDKNNIILYEQPIIITSRADELDLLNAWDGNFKINEEDNYILSAMVGAGKKHPIENTFSGVLMGDIGKADKSKHAYGLYGYDKGIQSFSFDINGRATIGRSGGGQITIDGNKGTIQSGNYISSLGADGAGMKIDLDDGQIDAYNFKLTANNLLMNSSPTEKYPYYFRMGKKGNMISLDKDQLNIESNNFLLQSETSTGDPFIIKSKLTENKFIDEQGHTDYRDDYLRIGGLSYGRDWIEKRDKEGNKIPIEGKPNEYEQEFADVLKLTGGIVKGSTIEGGVINGTTISAGFLRANKGYIGGWVIQDHKLCAQGDLKDNTTNQWQANPFIYLSADTKNEPYVISISNTEIDGTTNTYFTVDAFGKMMAKNVYVRGNLQMDDPDTGKKVDLTPKNIKIPEKMWVEGSGGIGGLKVDIKHGTLRATGVADTIGTIGLTIPNMITSISLSGAPSVSVKGGLIGQNYNLVSARAVTDHGGVDEDPTVKVQISVKGNLIPMEDIFDGDTCTYQGATYEFVSESGVTPHWEKISK